MDGSLPKWCPAVALSRQDGRHSAVALLLKAALIQLSNYRLLGASGCYIHVLNLCFVVHEDKKSETESDFDQAIESVHDDQTIESVHDESLSVQVHR